MSIKIFSDVNSIPKGYFTKTQAQQMKCPVQKNEQPIAHWKQGSHHISLFDRSQHPYLKKMFYQNYYMDAPLGFLDTSDCEKFGVPPQRKEEPSAFIFHPSEKGLGDYHALYDRTFHVHQLIKVLKSMSMFQPLSSDHVYLKGVDLGPVSEKYQILHLLFSYWEELPIHE